MRPMAPVWHWDYTAAHYVRTQTAKKKLLDLHNFLGLGREGVPLTHGEKESLKTSILNRTRSLRKTINGVPNTANLRTAEP